MPFVFVFRSADKLALAGKTPNIQVAAQIDFQQRFEDALNNEQLAKDRSLTTFELYATIAELLIDRAAAGDPFVDKELAKLEKPKRGEDRLEFALTRAGVAEEQTRLVRYKREEALAYLDRVRTDPDLQARIKARYGDGYKELLGGESELSDRLEATRKRLLDSKEQDPLVGDRATVESAANAALDVIMSVEPEVIAATEPGKLKTAKSVAFLLNNASIPMDTRDEFLGMVVETCLRLNSRREHKRTADVKDRWSVIQQATGNPLGAPQLGKWTPDGPHRDQILSTVVDAYRSSLGSVKTENLPDALLQGAGKTPPLVAPVAGADLRASVLRDIGFDSLRAVRTAEVTEDAKRELVGRLLMDLRSAIDGVLSKLVVRVRLVDPRGTSTHLADLRPYACLDKEGYTKAMAKRNVVCNDVAALECYVPCNSARLPLLEITQTEFVFWNQGPWLHLVDPPGPRIMRDFAELRIWSLEKRSPENSDLEKALSALCTPTQWHLAPPNADLFKHIETIWQDRPETDRKSGKTNGWFNLQRPYVGLYSAITYERHALFSGVVWLATAGNQGLEGRTDKVDDADYRWQFVGNLQKIQQEYNAHTGRQGSEITAEAIGALAGLNRKRMVDDKNFKWMREDRGGRGDVPATQFVFGTDGEQTFVLCATPYEKAVQGPVLFHYYRRVGFSSRSVMKRPTSRYGPYLQDVPAELRNGDDKKKVEFGINKPFSLNLDENWNALKYWRSMGAIKNKTNALGKRNPYDRLDAATVMKAIRPYIRGDKSNEGLAATELLHKIMATASSPALRCWQVLKDTGLEYSLVEQEWCHLQGHGDGGDERVGNFVAGTAHCNTEQLAIETAEREITQASDAKGEYSLKVTAYLIPDNTMELDKNKQGYLRGADRSYMRNAYAQIMDTSGDMKDGPEHKKKAASPELDLKLTEPNAPVASFIRYKISQKTAGGPKKLFDYVFEGQSEFFDQHQADILMLTVKYCLKPESFYQDLAEQIDALR